MADYSIEAQARTITGKKVSQLRTQGLVPATVYGPKTNAFSIQLPYRPLEITLMKAGGTNLIELLVDGKAHTVVARMVQRDPIKRTIRHVDFYEVDMAGTIRTSVPVQFVNESPAVVQKRGVLINGLNAINIEVSPSKMLHTIEVDLSVLRVPGATITVGDLKLPEGIIILDDKDEMLVKVVQTSASRSEEDLAAEEEAMSSAEPEVIHKGKQDEEDF